MPETREASVAEAAEQAAALRDYATAERLLRELLLLQKMRLGPLHADLANTFNNLGVVCDITDKPADAEFFYRRAMTIAKVSLAPEHEFVATSEKNLREFCAARGLPIEAPVGLRRPADDLPETAPPETPRLSLDVPAVEPSPAGSASVAEDRRPSIVPWAVAGLVAAIVIIAIWAWSNRGGQSSKADLRLRASPPVAQTPQPTAPAAAGTPAGESNEEKPAAPQAAAADAHRSTVPVAPATREGAAPAAPESAPSSGRDPVTGDSGRRDVRGGAAPTVASARLCRSLSTNSSRPFDDWPCENPGSPVDGGMLFFFTRVRSARDTVVEHRWYRGENLVKVVPLDVRASPTEGYRTYSRSVVDGRQGSDWRVELRTRDGSVLHEERFSVR